MKRTSALFLSFSLLLLSLNTSAYSVKEFKGDCKLSIKNCGRVILFGGKTVFGLAALYAAVMVPFASIYALRDTSALTGSIKGDFKKYRVTNDTVQNYQTGFEFKDINLLPVATVGVGIASTLSLVAGYTSLKSAWNDVQELLS